MSKDEIKEVVEMTIKCFKAQGMLKESDSMAYEEATAILKRFFREGQKDNNIKYALSGLRYDAYFAIIPKYFRENKTIETIADELGVDVSTIVRNKKRLCLEIYNLII